MLAGSPLALIPLLLILFLALFYNRSVSGCLCRQLFHFMNVLWCPLYSKCYSCYHQCWTWGWAGSSAEASDSIPGSLVAIWLIVYNIAAEFRWIRNIICPRTATWSSVGLEYRFRFRLIVSPVIQREFRAWINYIISNLTLYIHLYSLHDRT